MSCTQLHRVVNPNTEAMRQADRNTIVYFLHPDADFIIRCLDGSDTFEPVTDDTYTTPKGKMKRYATRLKLRASFLHKMDKL